MENYKDSLNNANENMMKLAQLIPNEMNSFMSLHDAALENGALDPKAKELIALGIGIAIRCETCILSHLNSLIKLGVTKKEIQETIAVAIFMGGGPSVGYGSKTLAAFEQLS